MPLTALRLAAFAVVAGMMLAGGAPAGAQAISGINRVVATHAEWQVVLADTNHGKLCYAAGSPHLREPEGAVRGRAFIFVTTRPDDRVRDEISIMFGFEVARRSNVDIGGETFALAGDSQGAWIADLADETRLVAAMRRYPWMSVQSLSELGEATTDTYSLDGFAAALDHARRECADGAPTN
ncbi:MAG: hypothetical protein JNK84_20985 [Phreatobacter sp.]|uniref:hypothetical protein n=1 Tax=Phreatobacter sp. TaxID=1966341 RepID=UPI001A5A4EA9|nr:hypothetical protein [Phreatobacter sp.]MBL8571560.1 hypothetical protein [Phreatobacter sp.]